MGDIGQIVASGINAASSAASAAQNYYYSKKLMDYQQKLQIAANRRQYGDTRYSLEQAGYNPLLAVNGASTGAQSSSLGSFTGADYGTPGSDFYNNKLTKAQETQASQTAIGQEIDNQLKPYMVASQIEVNSAQSSKARQDAISQSIQNEVLPQRVRAELSKTIGEVYKLDADTELARAQKDNVEENTKFVGYNAQSGRIQANASAQQAYNGEVANAINNFNAHTNRYNAKTNRYNAQTHRIQTEYDKYNNPWKFGSNLVDDYVNIFKNRK